MIALIDKKNKMYFMIVEWDHDKAIEKDQEVFPADMFPRDSNDCSVDDINECIHRMVEWINKDPAKNRMAIMSNVEDTKC